MPTMYKESKVQESSHVNNTIASEEHSKVPQSSVLKSERKNSIEISLAQPINQTNMST